MGNQEHVHKLGYRTNQDIQKSYLNLERLTGHPTKQIITNMTIISLFSGAGGLDLGLIQAGNNVIWANDIDADAVATYKANFRHLAMAEPSVS